MSDVDARSLPVPLPLPSTGKISEVIHLGDVHIPFLRPNQQHQHHWKYEQHAGVIASLVKSVHSVPSVRSGEAVVLVAGDVLDCKHAANAATVSLLRDLVEGLCTGHGTHAGGMLPVYITAGNHDICLDANMEGGPNEAADQTHFADLLGELLEPMVKRLPVAYIRETGVYGTAGSGCVFGVLHIRDAMVPGNCSGDVRAVEDMPLDLLTLPPSVEIEKDTKVFVYHGQVSGCRLQQGTIASPPSFSLPSLPAFPAVARTYGYDVCMFGDIHTMQLHGVDVLSPSSQHVLQDVSHDVHVGSFYWGPGRQRGIRGKAPLPWAYSGSTLQLSANERLFPHGYLRWCLRDHRVHAVHVKNAYGILFVSMVEEECEVHDEQHDGVGGVKTKRKGLLLHNGITPTCDEGVPEPQMIPVCAHTNSPSGGSWLPKNALVRILGIHGPVTMGHIEDIRMCLRDSCGVRVLGSSNSSAAAAATRHQLSQERQVQNDARCADLHLSRSGTTAMVDLSQFGNVDTWVEYVKENGRQGEENVEADAEQWEQWLRHPASLCIPTTADHQSPPHTRASTQGLPPTVFSKIQDRNAKLSKKCADVKAREDEQVLRFAAAETAAAREQEEQVEGTEQASEARDTCETKRSFSLRTLRWSWMLCYGPDNEFNFSKVEGRVALLSAPNGRGKSSMLEVLCIALFGHSMPSRGGKTSVVDALCRYRPTPDTPATCSVDVSLCSGTYRISRSFCVSRASGKLTSTARVSKLVPPHCTAVTQKDGSSAVNGWVECHLGTLSSFLLCSLLTQSSDADFFGMKPQEQKALLDGALALDVTRSVCEVLKEARLAHGAALDAVQTAIDTDSYSTGQEAARDDSHREKVVDDAMSLARDLEETRDSCMREHSSLVEGAQVASVHLNTVTSQMKSVGVDASALQTSQNVACVPLSVSSSLSLEQCVQLWQSQVTPSPADQGEAEVLKGFRVWCDRVASLLFGRLSLPPFIQDEAGCCVLEESLHGCHASMLKEGEELERADIEAGEKVRGAQDRMDSARKALLAVTTERTHMGHPGSTDTAVSDEQVDGIATKHFAEKWNRSTEQGKGLLDALEQEAAVAEQEKQEREGSMHTEALTEPEDPDVLRGMYDSAKSAQTAHREARDSEARWEQVFQEKNAALEGLVAADPDALAYISSPAPTCCSDTYDAERSSWLIERTDAIHHAARNFLGRDFLLDDKDFDYDSVYDMVNSIRDAHDEETGLRRVIEQLVALKHTEEKAGNPGGQTEDEDEPHNSGCWACVERKNKKSKAACDEQEAAERVDEKLVGAQNRADVLCRDNSHFMSLPSSRRSVMRGRMDDWLAKWRERGYSPRFGSIDLLRAWRQEELCYLRYKAEEARASLFVSRERSEHCGMEAREKKAEYQKALSRCQEAERLRSVRKKAHDTREEAKLVRSWLQSESARAAWAAHQNSVSIAAEEFHTSTEACRAEEAELARVREEWRSNQKQIEQLDRIMGEFCEEGGWKDRLSRVQAGKRARLEWFSIAEHCSRVLRESKQNTERAAAEVASRLTDVSHRCSQAKITADAALQWRDRQRDWCALRGTLEQRKHSIERLCSKMEGFSSWVYTHRALPAILVEVNALLLSMNVQCTLNGTCRVEDGGSLSWTMNGGTPMHKCSGMQRFAVSLAMRVALSQLGACNVTCSQLLIDEGFVALDVTNISSVPDFLHDGILGTGRYNSVVLVSHLEGVREAADVIVSITAAGGVGGTSHPQCSALRF